ncbi:MAG: hypothetical protein FD165_2176 [Gammaproteobacteria bacterium]|nr:MAG: hypothetical protein FD165_2176 [Gammaproteobacteria bacterium]TND05335.1 MAG: hypothetical protein FD120_1210 [Gammaproteobacteria bacterium]
MSQYCNFGFSRRWAVVTVAGLQLSWAAAVHADEWIFAPAVSTFAEYDDNPQLITTRHDSNTALILTPRVRAARYTDVTKIDVGAVLSIANNNNDVIDDEYSQRVVFRVNQKTSPLNTLVLDADIKRDTLRRDITGGGDVIADTRADIDSGLIVKDVMRNRLRFTPAWRRQLTQQSTLRLSYDLTDVTYSNDSGTGLVEYVQHAVSTGLGYQLTERNSIFGALGYSAYRPESNDTTDTVTLTGGFGQSFTETSEGSFSVGLRDTTTTTGSKTDSSTGFVLRGWFNQRTETGSVAANVERSVSPSGVGRLLEASQLDFQWRNHVTERMSTQTKVSAYRTAEVDNSLPSSLRRYASLELGVSWALARNIYLDSLYRFRRQGTETVNSAANSNAIYFGINYGTVENERFSGALTY